MFPKKMHIENTGLRTFRVNEAVKYIYLINNNLEDKKIGQNENNPDLSCQVNFPIQISNLFLMDLRRLASLAG